MNNPSTRGHLFIGHGVIAKGTVSAPGEAIIDGEMSGDITAEKITVGKTGKLTANAAANFIDVAGEVTQKTIATVSLSIKSGGVVSGEVSYGDLEIMKGGEIMGTITQIPK
jgi:cytoskeletal protein CcmA (bactofilin family)